MSVPARGRNACDAASPGVAWCVDTHQRDPYRGRSSPSTYNHASCM